VKKLLLTAILAACLPFLGCKDSAKNYPVQFVDRNTAFSLDNKSNPLRLVIEINENGKLRLNKIETGTIEDTTFLSEKLKTIFADREKASISEREIVIDPRGEVEEEDLEMLIESLAGANAEPILIIKSDL